MVAQKSIHQYKYIIVSDKFDFFKSADKYHTSSLTKFLFNKYGFKSYLSIDKFPDDFNSNRCLALFVDLKDSSGIVRTKISIEFKDCNNSVIFTSKEGSSKSKDYKTGYHEAIRDAFKHIKVLNYKYVPNDLSEKKEAVVILEPEAVKKEVKPIPKNIKKKTEKKQES